MARSGSRDLVVAAFAISIILSIHFFTAVHSSPNSNPNPSKSVADEDDEDLSFLEEPVDSPSQHHSDADSDAEEPDGEGFDMDDESSSAGDLASVDEKDVVVLTANNFTDFISKSKHVMVEFYAPWCGHCRSLAPEYARAATDLKDQGEDVSLAKVDATVEEDLAQKYEVQGYPTILFFINGEEKQYPGDRTKDAIITWIKKKVGPGIYNITTVEEAQTILTSQKAVVLGFLDSLVGSESQELASASKLEDDVNFYQTVNPDVAKLFSIDPKSKLPSLVLVKNETEKLSYFDESFTKSAIVDFVFSNKFPLVSYLTNDNIQLIFEGSIKNVFLLFATSKYTEKLIPLYEEAAKLFKGKILFIYVEVDREDVCLSVANYFGLTGETPNVLAISGNDEGKKYLFKGKLTVENIKVFGDDFLQDKLMNPFYKSDPIPEANDGDVKVVVGNNFDQIVLDESKDVLLEVYAPWCVHCQGLEPVYNKLAHHLNGIESLVIAKMDGTTNEHPRAKADGFPTLLFYPAGNKSFEPISAEVDRTVVAFYKFIKKHASIPFKLQKPASPGKIEGTDAAGKSESSTDDRKDEL